MTVEEAKRKLVALAEAQIGYREGAGNWNKYAADSRIERLYGWNPQCQPWCCVFVNWLFLEAFGFEVGSQLTYGGTAACANSAALFRQNGALKTEPEIGDQVFFFAAGGINHTGLVVDVSGGTIRTVEGNYSDGVGTAAYSSGSGKIAGYGRPNWKLVESLPAETATMKPAQKEKTEPKPAAPAPAKNDHKLKLEMIQKGAVGNAVRLAQAALNARSYSCGLADGIFGRDTDRCVRTFQKDFSLDPDGIVGPLTWAELLRI